MIRDFFETIKKFFEAISLTEKGNEKPKMVRKTSIFFIEEDEEEEARQNLYPN